MKAAQRFIGNNITGSPKPSDIGSQMEMKQMYLQPGGL
jgi:hypothetical protein